MTVQRKNEFALVEQLARNHGTELIRAIARRLQRRSDADDIAQEAYLRLLRHERKDLIRDPLWYVHRIASNVLIEFEIRKNREKTSQERLADPDAQSLAADDQADTLALRTRLEAVLEELPPKCRAVLILHRRDGRTYDEIARELRISASMVKKYLIRGLRHCRERLGEYV